MLIIAYSRFPVWMYIMLILERRDILMPEAVPSRNSETRPRLSLYE